MKKIFTFLYCMCSVWACAQDRMNKFHVIDDQTRKPVPAVSISIVRAKLSITTEKDGIFIIPGALEKMRDTVILSAQNYTALKMQLAGLSGMDTIRLSKQPVNPLVARSTYKDDTLLNNYNKDQIGYFAGVHTETSLFEYLQLAQRFEVQKAGVLLKKVKVNKLSFSELYDPLDPHTQYQFTELEHTRYRLRIYDVDPSTGGPGRDLCDHIIEVKSLDSEQSGVNLRSYNIVVPTKTFFVAIEWMRDHYNAGYCMVYNAKLKKEVQVLNYRPTIGISPITGKQLNIWAMNFKHEWKPFTYFSPFGTDLAIKATVEY